MNDNLPPLPCPFCGEQPKTTERPDNIDGTRFFFAVVCYCGTYSASAHKMAVRNTPEQAKADAISAWNTRAAIEKDRERQSVPAGYVLVPIRPTQEILDVTDSEGWTWPELLAAAGSITEAEADDLAAAPQPQPTNCRHCGGPENVLCAGQCRPAKGEKQ